MKKSIIKHHLSSNKHVKSKDKIIACKEEREGDIAEILVKYENVVYPVGERKLSEEVRVYRYKVVSAFRHESRCSFS